MLERTFILGDTQKAESLMAFLKRNAKRCAEAGHPLAVVVTEYLPTKTRDQEMKYHAMIGDIADQCVFLGMKRDAETWKRLLVDAFAKVKAAEGDPLPGYGQILPSLDGMGVVQLGPQTRRFKIKHGSEFIEHLYAFGAEGGVVWTDPKQEKEQCPNAESSAPMASKSRSMVRNQSGNCTR